MRRGIETLDSAARLVALAVLILGTAAGITVSLVFDVSPWLTAVVLMGLLAVVVLEGSYRAWQETDRARLSALTARDAATQDLENQRQAHEKALAAAQAGYESRVAAAEAEHRAALEAARSPDGQSHAATPPPTGLEVVIDEENPHPFPGRALILEIEYHVTNHDTSGHRLYPRMRSDPPSSLFFPPVDRQREPEYLEILYAYGRISERQIREPLPPQVRAGETVRGVYVAQFAWNPRLKLPYYTLIVSDGRREYEGRPTHAEKHVLLPGERLSTGQSLCSPDGRYRFTMQDNADMIVFDGDRPLSKSDTARTRSEYYLTLREDGELALYRADDDAEPQWTAEVQGKGGNSLEMQSDHNLVLYSREGRVWSSWQAWGCACEEHRRLPVMIVPGFVWPSRERPSDAPDVPDPGEP